MVEIARQMKRAMEAEEEAELEASGAADVFSRKRRLAGVKSEAIERIEPGATGTAGVGHGDPFASAGRAGGLGDDAGTGFAPAPGDRQDPGVEPLTTWR